MRSVCGVLGDTQDGLTGSEIGKCLRSCNIDDPCPERTKRDRLFEALHGRQERDRCGNNVVAFIMEAMAPVGYVGCEDVFNQRRDELNKVIAFTGLSLGEDGKLMHVSRVQTLSEAEQRADRLRKTLRDRQVHLDVLKFCRSELLEKNYFHAVLEATKSVAEKIRHMTGLKSDGTRLVNEALGLDGKRRLPLLAFNKLETESELSEHRGLTNLFRGMFGAFRNPTGHAPKILWPINEQDALDIFSLISLLHRRLDSAVAIPSRE